VVISDLLEEQSAYPPHPIPPSSRHGPVGGSRSRKQCSVEGGYLERLPLASVRAGLAEFAEIWHHHRGAEVMSRSDSDHLTRRAFPVSGDAAPFHSEAMLRFIAEHGAPRILCVWGLGVSEAILETCADSFIIYNSIDVPALRVPPEVSRRFDLVLTGAPWQSQDVLERHPQMPTAVLPIGPDFASPETFFPIPGPKLYDVVYVAAAQPYKRHDVLFGALARSERPLRALCVIGYGEDGERLRREAAERGLAVDFVGPPGVPHSEVNRLINQARVGVVCGVDDGAPAILTEYMLAGLPVVANSALRCGLQYILPQTGLVASADTFEHAIAEALARDNFSPRQTVLDRWAWPHSIGKLGALIDGLPPARALNEKRPERVGGQFERADFA
jgi:glycosyltransferase involved in cell wall biosynthesis